MGKSSKNQSVLGGVFDFLSSFKLSVSILLLMFVVTWLGTLAQAEMGLYRAQAMYFDSLVFFQPLPAGLRMPLPGGLALMAALSVNLIAGGIVRLRWDWRRTGILITHFGIAFMMLAGAVKFAYSHEGGMQLFEGQKSTQYTSYHDFELVIEERESDGALRQYIVPGSEFAHATDADVVTVAHPRLPFSLELGQMMPNSLPTPKGPMFNVDVPVIDGFFLREREWIADEDGRNVLGCYAAALDSAGERQSGILWGFMLHPWTVEFEGRRFGLMLQRQTFELPFEIELVDFDHAFHPGTRTPRKFLSDVNVIDSEQSTAARIEMNDPLRRGNFVVFQSTWGPAEGPADRALYSGFAIVSNPSDKWPEWACYVIGLGLSLHFIMMLSRFIRREVAKGAVS